MSLLGLALWLIAAPAPAVAAAPAPPTPPRTAPVSALIHSESFKRITNGKPQAFRVDYTASLTWTLGERKSCYLTGCGTVCDMTISHKVLSRQVWWLPPALPPVLAENSQAQREYSGGVITFRRLCKAVSDHDVARGAADRLRPYQFAGELIKDRSLLLRDADDYLALNLPPAPTPPSGPPPS